MLQWLALAPGQGCMSVTDSLVLPGQNLQKQVQIYAGPGVQFVA